MVIDMLEDFLIINFQILDTSNGRMVDFILVNIRMV